MKYIVGIDEAGRGPLAGPVAIGICAIPSFVHKTLISIPDSKALTERARLTWFQDLQSKKIHTDIRHTVSLVGERVIDEKGISHAIALGISRGLKRLNLDPHEVEVVLDGGLRAPAQYVTQETFIKGDSRFPVIALASIAAKVTRDKKMMYLHKKYPQYRFDVHKGYGTLKHREVLRTLGASPVHRRTFLSRILGQ